MEIQARAKYIHVGPRKLRLVADLVRNMPAESALTILSQLSKTAARPLITAIKSAIANATNNAKLKSQDLKIKTIEVGQGTAFKRWRAVARGSAHGFKKRTSHIRVVLEG